MDLDFATIFGALYGVLDYVDCGLLYSLFVTNHELRNVNLLLWAQNITKQRIDILIKLDSAIPITNTLNPTGEIRKHVHPDPSLINGHPKASLKLQIDMF